MLENHGIDMSRTALSRLARAIFLTALGMGIAAAPAIGREAASAQEANGTGIRAVLELFTSQGCSSCPPADALLAQYAAHKDLIALSLPVDYWDYLGWKDTLAKPKFSARQKHYAKKRGDGRIYTPQMVVNGRTHVIGSSAPAIDAAIEATARELDAVRVPVTIQLAGQHLTIETGPAPSGSSVREATIWLALVHRTYEIKVERGENRGKTITYANVVRELNPIGVWMGEPDTLQISREAVAEPDNEMCVVFLQVGKAGAIIGAASISGL
jgi:hypothetical protein